ncbi:hypothetical protein GQ457_07G006060 [Hibiscus cannabinus]
MLDRWIRSDPTVEIYSALDGADGDTWQQEMKGHCFWRDALWTVGSDLIQRLRWCHVASGDEGPSSASI